MLKTDYGIFSFLVWRSGLEQAKQVADTKELLDMVHDICRSHGRRLETAMRDGTDPSSTVMA